MHLSTDPVSMIGIHYGRIATLPYSGLLDAHGIGTVIGVLESNATGGIPAEHLTRR
ncbi:MAG: hypothetical protein R3E97_24140 [Candidatus Eisenbacteria bacterium]